MKKKKFFTKYRILAKNSDWSFAGNVYKRFDEHINKSIPLYNLTHQLYLDISDFFLQQDSKILDIGCSTGSFLNKIYDRHKNNSKKVQFIGIDNVKQMINYCKKKYNNKKIKFFLSDVLKYNFSKKYCLISSFYTIQFITPKLRQNLINKIYNSLNWGGAFFMVEKVRGPDARFQDILSQIYTEYKISQGFSEIEILNKARSLKGILEPFTSKANIEMLKRSGFTDITTVFKYGCFEGFLAIK